MAISYILPDSLSPTVFWMAIEISLLKYVYLFLMLLNRSIEAAHPLMQTELINKTKCSTHIYIRRLVYIHPTLT